MPSACRPWSAEAAVLALALAAAPAAAAELPSLTEAFGADFVGVEAEVSVEATGFLDAPLFAGQDRDALSVAGEFTLTAEWLGGDLVFSATPFLRLDSADSRRTHGDLREFKLDWISGPWSVTAGVDRVFWGKTEAVHLVDIVNQTDQVEGLDDEEQLGQPMIRISRLVGDGQVSFFLLPVFRDRTFPGSDGRLRFATPVNTARPIFETEAERLTPSFALRYATVIDAWDIGVSAFHGLSRDPAFFFDGQSLRPVYSRITQGAVDLQYTSGATLWKAEALVREGQRNASFRRETYGAVTGGIEHTLYQVFETDSDLGLILEGAWDSRGRDSLSAFEGDVIGGMRLTLNDAADTALLVTGAVDATDGAVALRLEGERRLSDGLTLSIEAQGFLNQPAGSPFRRDSFVRTTLSYYF